MPKIAPADGIEALDLPRSRSGLNVYYELLSRTTPDLRCVIRSAPAAAAHALRARAFLTLRPVGRSAGGGRWMHSPAGGDLLVELRDDAREDEPRDSARPRASSGWRGVEAICFA